MPINPDFSYIRQCIDGPFGDAPLGSTITIMDSMGRGATNPDDSQRTAWCSAEFIRYFVSLNATENIVCVDYSDSNATPRKK